MKSFGLYGKFLKESCFEVMKNFSLYLNCYIAFIVVDLLASIPWAGLGYEDNSFASIITSVIVGIINLIIVVQVILIEKATEKSTVKEQLLYAAPTYLIYTLYYSIIFIIGFACFIIPGIILILILGLAPLASVLIDNDSVNYFKLSYQLAKKDIALMVAFILASLVTELMGLAFDFIQNWQVKFGVSVVYSFLDALILIVVTKASVKTFYYLKSITIGESAY